MSFLELIRRLFSNASRQLSQRTDPRYDDVQIVNVVDGTTIKGHEAVKAHIEQEEKLHKEYGTILIFQVYRMNLQARSFGRDPRNEAC